MKDYLQAIGLHKQTEAQIVVKLSAASNYDEQIMHLFLCWSLL